MKQAPFTPGDPPIVLDVGRVGLFTDLHLREDAPEEIESFVARLENLPSELNALIVMGDLFDAWTGPEQWGQSAFLPLRRALETAAERLPVWLLRGNRDVMFESADAAALGVGVTDSILLRGEEDRRALVTHGDEFCLRDLPYQRLRRWLRRRSLRAVARRLPWSWRRYAAGKLRQASREAVARKPLDTLALVEEAVVLELERHDAQQAVIGHLHVEEHRPLPGGRDLWVLPAWAPTTEVRILTPAGWPDARKAGRISPSP